LWPCAWIGHARKSIKFEQAIVVQPADAPVQAVKQCRALLIIQSFHSHSANSPYYFPNR
jgi:hypothetical protein